MFVKSLLSIALLAVKSSATIWYAGVAEAGGEFGVWSPTASPVGLPGTLGVEYAFISKPAIDIYVDQNKVNLFRVAFLLERMCPLSLGLGARFSESHFAEFADAVNYITVTKKAYCILDPHNYMRYNNPFQQPMTGSIIGNTADVTAATTAQFAAFWGEMARRFVSNEKVIFGLMNEPHDMDNNLVLTNNQAAINAIRATGAKQLILAPGGGWTGGHSWTTGYAGNSPPNSEVMVRLTDPINNTAFDIHEYLDTDFSGGHALCEKPAAANLAGVTSWLRDNNFKAMITEFGGSNGTQCASYITDMVNYMAANPEYIGWTAWSAGPIWGSYSPCCTDQRQWGSLEPNSVASDGSPGLYTTVWLRLIQPLLPRSLQWTGVAHVNGPAGGSVSSSSSTTRSSSSTTLSTTLSTTVSTTISRTSSLATTTLSRTSSTTTSIRTSSATTTTRTTSAVVPTTTSASGGGPLANHWDKCGGEGWTGPTACVAPWVCKFNNQWYSQCL